MGGRWRGRGGRRGRPSKVELIRREAFDETRTASIVHGLGAAEHVPPDHELVPAPTALPLAAHALWIVPKEIILGLGQPLPAQPVHPVG